jgi:transcription elongation factor Elf1
MKEDSYEKKLADTTQRCPDCGAQDWHVERIVDNKGVTNRTDRRLRCFFCDHLKFVTLRISSPYGIIV